jgi:membrane protein implicated in regulation of membrane protease activity
LANRNKKSKGTIWPIRVLFRYALFQIPGLAGIIFILILIRRWVDLPPWFFWGVVAIWLAKDVILFPLVWRAYDRDRLKESHSLVGTEGTVEKQLAPSGYIRIHGELWRAQVVEHGSLIQKGQTVKVQGIRGLTLLVRPEGQEKTETHYKKEYSHEKGDNG